MSSQNSKAPEAKMKKSKRRPAWIFMASFICG